MPISSDPIETLFSKYKSFQKRSPEGDPTRTVALLPLLAREDNSNEIQNYLLSTSHSEAKKWVEKNIPETIHSKKRRLYQKTKNKRVPKSGKQIVQTERPYERAVAA